MPDIGVGVEGPEWCWKDGWEGSRFPNAFRVDAVFVVDPQSLPEFLASMTLSFEIASASSSLSSLSK
jgi:hypothetical protein